MGKGSNAPSNGSPKKKGLNDDHGSSAGRNTARVIPMIRVTPGETEVSIDGNRSENPPMCFVSEATTVSARSSNGSMLRDCATVATPLEVGQPHTRMPGRRRKSYWRRRMEQFDHENEVDATTLRQERADRHGGNTASLQDDLPTLPTRQPSVLFQEGCIASLPLLIQVGFRRKMFSVFALQLLAILALMTLLTYEDVLSTVMERAFQHSGWYLLGTLTVMVVFLVMLYFGHAVYPINWLILAVFSVALSVFLASVQVFLNTNAGIFCCGFTFFAVLIMIPLSGIERRVSDADGVESRTLLSTTTAGLIAFSIVLVVAGILYGIFENRFVSSGPAFGLSIVLEFALILWFSYDASTMYRIMSPDEYMSGVIFFYTDLLVVIVIIVVFGALALLFSSAGMGAGGFGGSCDCFGCLRVGRVFGGDTETNRSGPTSSPVLPMTDSVGRRDSVLSAATVVPEEMLR